MDNLDLVLYRYLLKEGKTCLQCQVDPGFMFFSNEGFLCTMLLHTMRKVDVLARLRGCEQ